MLRMNPKIPFRSLETIEIGEDTTVMQFDRRGTGPTFTFFGPTVVELRPDCAYVVRRPNRTDIL